MRTERLRKLKPPTLLYVARGSLIAEAAEQEKEGELAVFGQVAKLARAGRLVAAVTVPEIPYVAVSRFLQDTHDLQSLVPLYELVGMNLPLREELEKLRLLKQQVPRGLQRSLRELQLLPSLEELLRVVAPDSNEKRSELRELHPALRSVVEGNLCVIYGLKRAPDPQAAEESIEGARRQFGLSAEVTPWPLDYPTAWHCVLREEKHLLRL
jgi:hypothetical protein